MKDTLFSKKKKILRLTSTSLGMLTPTHTYRLVSCTSTSTLAEPLFDRTVGFT